MDDYDPVSSGSDLPPDVLRVLFGCLAPRDLAAVSCVCTLWRHLADGFWRGHVEQRWKHGHERYALTEQDHATPSIWRDVYRQRHQADMRVKESFDDLVYPLKRSAACEAIFALHAATSATDVLLSLMNEPGRLLEGQRYWALYVLSRLQVKDACDAMERSLRSSHDPQEASLDAGILIAQVHAPTRARDVRRRVEGQLRALAAELRQRMEAAGVAGGMQALKLLNELLFGNPPPGPNTVAATAADADAADVDAAAATAAAAAGGAHPPDDDAPGFAVPPAPYGLGLQGNEADYYSPNNSLLHEVLATRRGIPITLALLHMVVGRRVGLNVEMCGTPMRVVNRFVTPGEPGKEEEREAWIDCYGSGAVLTWEGLCQLMGGLGAAGPSGLARRHATPMTPLAVAQRMCANLVAIYADQQAEVKLHAMLQLATSVNNQARDYAIGRFKSAIQLRDFDDAAATLQLPCIAIQFEQYEHLSMVLAQLRQEHEEDSAKEKRVAPGMLYRVGQIMRHSRYGYVGVIVDHDAQCSMPEQWIDQQGVNALPGGRQQPFYHMLSVSLTTHQPQETYVAQCNVQRLELGVRCPASTTLWGGVLPSITPTEDTLTIQHPDVGRYFDGRAEGSSTYVPNAYVYTRHPDDFPRTADVVDA